MIIEKKQQNSNSLFLVKLIIATAVVLLMLPIITAATNYNFLQAFLDRSSAVLSAILGSQLLDKFIAVPLSIASYGFPLIILGIFASLLLQDFTFEQPPKKLLAKNALLTLIFTAPVNLILNSFVDKNSSSYLHHPK